MNYEDDKLPSYLKQQKIPGWSGAVNNMVRALMAGAYNPNASPYAAPAAPAGAPPAAPLGITPPAHIPQQAWPPPGGGAVPFAGVGGNQLWGARDPVAALLSQVPPTAPNSGNAVY
jgi:hypothetical protein